METLKSAWKWILTALAFVGTVLWILFSQEKHDQDLADLALQQAEELARRDREAAHARNLAAKRVVDEETKKAVQDAMATGDYASHINSDIGKGR